MINPSSASYKAINFAYTAGGAPLGFTYNGTPYYYILSLQGDIHKIYDSNGNIVAEYTYDAWGKLISISGSMADTIGVKNPLRYRGYYYDTETGFYYLQSRYYDSETSRFINADAYLIAGNDLIQGTNMYAYCINNPILYVDYDGYCYGYPNDPNLNSTFSGVPYGYNCGSYGRHVRNPKNVKSNVSAENVVGYSSDALGMVGTGLEVAANNSSKLTNIGGGVWKMQTTKPKVASTGKGIGAVVTGIGATLAAIEICNLLVTRDDLSTGQKTAGTVIDLDEFGASVGVDALASTVGTTVASSCVAAPVALGVLAAVRVGTVVIYYWVDYLNDKAGI